jgi:hypothetical protein
VGGESLSMREDHLAENGVGMIYIYIYIYQTSLTDSDVISNFDLQRVGVSRKLGRKDSKKCGNKSDY